jgi:hypothetical protein
MKTKIFICAFIYFCSINILNAQTYYGTNKLGRLEILNDSLYSVSFYALNEITYVDTGTYKRNNDTILLNSKVKRPFEVIDRDEEYDFPKTCNRLFIKHYIDFKKGWQLVYEYNASHMFFDSINNQLICNWMPSDSLDILVISNSFIYRRLRKTGVRTQFFTIKFLDDKNKMDRIYFDNFPLKIKGNKLIPIDKKKNEQCWVDNGFYFPKMKKSNTKKEYDRIIVSYRGLRGLPSGFDIK